MPIYSRILVAVDLAAPQRARDLLAQARGLCTSCGTIRLLHVLQGHVTRERRANAMAGLLALCDAPDPRILPVLRDGAVAPQIRAMVDEDGVDLIMLASRPPGLAEFFRDTQATRVVRHAALSVLVARQPHPERSTLNV